MHFLTVGCPDIQAYATWIGYFFICSFFKVPFFLTIIIMFVHQACASSFPWANQTHCLISSAIWGVCVATKLSPRCDRRSVLLSKGRYQGVFSCFQRTMPLPWCPCFLIFLQCVVFLRTYLATTLFTRTTLTPIRLRQTLRGTNYMHKLQNSDVMLVPFNMTVYKTTCIRNGRSLLLFFCVSHFELMGNRTDLWTS